MTNNLAEYFNSWILPLRSLPIFDIVDEIKLKIMDMIADWKEDIKSWFIELCLVMEKKIKENLETLVNEQV
ncbi:hypothetical protein RchiOBHm_Chr4g0384871 [Rosa chinensis]|uniref:Uncharacterized protein n=1 Tax=Rosa chinensis TaxID=74649 RepID=A0A2P6QNT3_ROSCH|nr:hypothetical protein RchiOBHm_Chr4g0384871 [Rosa chinensis]